jgi:hypothetical protein
MKLGDDIGILMCEAAVEYLRSHGYDGLCNPDTECGCTLADLAPCGECHFGCFPAYDHGAIHGADHWMSRRKPIGNKP